MHVLDIIDVDNLVDTLDQTVLDKMGSDVVDEYLIDKASMSDWMERNKLAFDLINMKSEKKTVPWSGSASTKLPLVLNAAMKASAEEHAEILRGEDIVKAKIFGSANPEKTQRAQRVTDRMNYQFLYELEDWEEDHDKLILAKNIVGTVHKKLFYADGKINCVLRRNGVVINDNVERIQDAPRITDEIDKYGWEVTEKITSGQWADITLTSSDEEHPESDKVNRFLEQIRREDLDGDGYPEIYVVTVHEETKTVVRITSNFTPDSIEFDNKIDVLEYEELSGEDKAVIKSKLTVVRIDGARSRLRYVKYSMIPSWEGGYWDFGYGMLLAPLNENCNALVNHLLNAGHLATNGGGFINSGIKMKGGELKFKANEWKKVQSPGMDLSRNIVPMPVREPSQTLFSLLGLLMEVLKDLSSVTEVMSGNQPKANMPAASIDMLIEQGRKLFNSVYKRHYRSLSKEQKAVYDLDYLYQDPKAYGELLDIDASDEELRELARADFNRGGLDLIPTANPEFSTRGQRVGEARASMEFKDDPRVNGQMVIRNYFEAVYNDAEVVDQLVPAEGMMTTEQAMQQAEQQKQEFLNSNEAKISEANAKVAEIELQMKAMEAQMQGVELPIGLREQKLKVEKAAIAVDNERIKNDRPDTSGV